MGWSASAWSTEGWSKAPGGGVVSCPAATTFLARTSGLDTTHTNAYTNLICGMASDGLLNADGTSNFFDALYVFATQDSTTALLNLISGATSPAAAINTPTFTADRGFKTTDGGIGDIRSGINLGIGGVNYARNSAHISIWSVDSVTPSAGGASCGLFDSTTGTSAETTIFLGATACSYAINDLESGASASRPIPDTTGHYLANRSGASAQQGYRNAVDQGVVAVASGALFSSANGPIFCALDDLTIGPRFGLASNIAMGSFGASLTSGQVTGFYNRLRTYMTAVGVP